MTKATKKKVSNHVVPVKDKRWVVKKSGTTRASRSFETKKQAIQYGQKISKKEKSELYIHKKDGTVQEKNSYNNGLYS